MKLLKCKDINEKIEKNHTMSASNLKSNFKYNIHLNMELSFPKT